MTRRGHQPIVPLAALAGIFVVASPAAAQDPAYPARPGEVVIRFEDGTTAAERAAILEELGATDVKEFRRTATTARARRSGPASTSCACVPPA